MTGGEQSNSDSASAESAASGQSGALLTQTADAPAAARSLRRTRLRFTAAVLTLGLLYLFIVEKLGRGIPCLFFEFTGYRCPGCGVTRMFRALAHLDVARAFHCNAAAMVILPFVGFQTLAEHRTPPPSERLKLFFRRMDWFFIAVLLVFGAVRNIPSVGVYLNP